MGTTMTLKHDTIEFEQLTPLSDLTVTGHPWCGGQKPVPMIAYVIDRVTGE
jgi:hypothetical protein